MTVTLQFQATGAVPGQAGPVTMRGPSLTIGRGEENDLALPDPDRSISRNHCVIENKGGQIVVVDLSSNGTFLNYSKTPLGKKEAPLNDGDIISVGPYELIVNIGGPQLDDDPLAGIAPPMQDPKLMPGNAGGIDDIMSPVHGGGEDFLDGLLAKPTSKGTARNIFPEDESGILPPLGEEDDPLLPSSAKTPFSSGGATYGASSPVGQDHYTPPPQAGPASIIPDDFDDEFAPTPQAPPPKPAHEIPPEPLPPTADEGPGLAPPMADQAPEPAPVTQAAPTGPVGNQDAAVAFLTSLGIDPRDIPEEELVATMERLGGVLNKMILGIREVLMTRTSIKSEFRMNQTQIQATGNNPLKFSVSEELALQAMAKPAMKGFQGAEAATEEALKDIRAHEISMVTGMQSALRDVLLKLDPSKLEEEVGGSGGLSGIFKGQKARSWETYKAMYAKISEQAEEDFHELFAKAFAKAYMEQMEKL